MTDTTALTPKKHPLVTLRERFESRKDELKNSLPSDISPDRFIRAITTTAQINADLLTCTFPSLWLACMRACRDGLLPDNREGAIVAFKDKATWIPMYQGLLKRVAPNVRWVTANVVYEGEDFSYWIDEHGEHLKHVPDEIFDDRMIKKVYAMAETKDGGTFIAVLPRAEIDKIRKVSRATREDAPWAVRFGEMAKKTALRRLCKKLPIPAVLPEEEEDEEAPKIVTTAEPRERGAAAALDMFAGSPEEPSAANVPPESGETGGGAETEGTVESIPAQTPNSSPAAADVSAADLLAQAHQRGQEAKAAKMPRKALPGEYRDPKHDDLAQAWFAGHDGKPL